MGERTIREKFSSDFNISGTGKGNIFDAATQYNLGGNRVLSIGGVNTTLAGIGAGQANTGSSNSFFGKDSGKSNTSGGANSFFGNVAGEDNTVEGIIHLHDLLKAGIV